MPARQQPTDEMGSHETRAAGDEYPHATSSRGKAIWGWYNISAQRLAWSDGGPVLL